MANSDDIIIVEALYSFKGKNNDELCFNKGDIITVTQREEGGWWEGTLNDKTGWFPSNYTKECKIQDGGPGSPLRGDSQLLSPNHSQQQQVYKLTIVKEIIESERSHLAELQNLLGGHLIELRKADILLEAEYCQLIGNLEDVCYCHTLLVKSLEEQAERPSREQRIGGVFLSLAPKLQGVHKAYCSNHPRAVCILEKYKDELNSFMEREGAVRPGIMVLTTALSKPFRRLDKYAGMLQEYERHLEEGHPDRGDTQRSSHVYKDLASSCSSIRRQKELELEVVTGRVHGWDGGETLGALGEVLRMGSVALLPDHRDRYLVLFPTTLVMLAVSPRMSAFIFEGNYPLKSIHVTKLEDGDHYKNAFEVTGPPAERIIALCQTKEDQLQWVEVLSQQSRLARSTNFTPHKSSLTSPHVSSSHVSDWPYVTEESTLHPSSRYLCMTCGLPYFLDAMGLPRVKYSDDSDGSIGKEGCHDSESAVNLVVCTCKIPQVKLVISTPNLTTQMLSEQTCEKMYIGRPYTVLTKFFSNMYRRKVITKKLLRYLSGDKQDESQVQTVQLRRHRTECSILTGCSSSDDSGDEICEVKIKKRSSTESSETSESSIEGCIWAEPKVKTNTAVTVTPLLTTENMALPLSTSNLQKWRYQGKELSASVSSSESGVSTDGSNPYGYVRYYNPEDSNLGLYKPDEMHSYGEISTGMTCSKLCSEDSPDFKGYKSVSSEDSFYSATHEIPVKTMQVTVSTESKVLSDDFSSFMGVEGIRHTRSKKSCSCNINDNKDYLSSDADQFGGVANSASLPVLSSDYICKSVDASVEPKIVHSSVLNIPANPIILPSVIPSVESDELSDSTPNICNKTIYENSNSSDDIMVLEKIYSEFEPLKTNFPFKSKPNVVYYVSSCSGDEMGNDGGDYYESQRKHIPVSMTVSHSEPNLSVSTPPVDCDLQKVKFSSHFVQLVCDVENPSKVCSCESYSHRSSDSGLADIVHHLEFCPLRSETPGIGRGSCLSHCSQSSQFSGAKLSRCESSYQIRPLTPDCSGDTDSLLPTPMTTPYTSNPLSYTTDSISSLYGSGSLRYSPSSHPPVLCTTHSGGNREDVVFRSGLYAHWWMKASVCPKMLVVDKVKKDYLRFRADKKPEVPPKPNFLKPSYHVRRGGMSGAVVKPLSKSTSTQTNLSHGHPVRVHIVPQSSSSTTFNKNDNKETDHYSNPVVKAKLQNVPSHLDIHCSPSIPRNPSFESQSSQISQITVIPKLNYQTIEITPEFQEQLAVPNRKCLNAVKGRLKGSQESSSNSNNSCYELSSLHSFNECCSRDGNPFHVRDSSEGLDVDFHRRASSQSLCAGVSDSTTFTSSIYCKLQPFQSVDDSVEASELDRLASFGVSGADKITSKSKPDLPPKPKNLLMSWPIQRSKSLPKLPSSVSIHKKSKDFCS